ncbi:hypothetical protein HID58_061395 [Brassica napus]|uniref:BnaCnng14650D protein n=2 Tax=Brassica napus TaxID=3708 RepID=A0A078IDR1_BRANA|nr:uncharacterized protein At4g13200, chloroplastic [Brassica napus]KAH0885299.1 hypothetical protein HID58_061395 [Brassica napus]CAF1857105.1 unnamed protein product [Brassica napus]CDY47328.1 BnaCnng14650D [Brassica napus]
MSNYAIPLSSSSSLSNAYHQPSRVCFVFRNPRSNFEFRGTRLSGGVRSTSLKCNCCSKGKGGTGSGENENRNVLDAFFLGKALAEVINERIESTVGEVLGNIGRFQAEQQRQVQEIQGEVLERAKKAKERAARETMEAQGLVPESTNPNPKPAAGVVASVVTPTSIVESKALRNDEKLSGFSGSSMGDDMDSSSSSYEDSV